MNDWLKLTDQQLNKYLMINLSTAEEKNDAAKRMLVSLDHSEGKYLQAISNLSFHTSTCGTETSFSPE
jgi:hypothetical protein